MPTGRVEREIALSIALLIAPLLKKEATDTELLEAADVRRQLRGLRAGNTVLPAQINEQRSELPIKIVIGIASALADNSSILEAGHRYLESPQCLSCVNLGGCILGTNFEA